MVDEINFVIYESDLHPDLKREVRRSIRGKEKVKIVKTVYDRIFDWNRVTNLYNEQIKKPGSNWYMIADIDEFHVYPESPNYIVSDCDSRGWEVIRGGFIDRIGNDGEFSEIKEGSSIFDQFPIAGFFRYPMSGACPNKVCLVKQGTEITSGQHYAKIGGHTTWRWQGWNHPMIAPVEKYSAQVHHFKWDSTCLERIKKVADINQDYSYSDEYKVMYDAIKRNKSRIDIINPEFMFEYGCWRFKDYEKWDILIKKIISI
jgi:hypothetical protein